MVWVAGKGLSGPVQVELDRVSADPARPHGFLFRTSPRAGIVVEVRFVAAQVEARRARDGALLWRFGGPELVGTAQLCRHEGTLAVLSPFGSIPSHGASLYGLDARTGAPRWIRDYRAEGLRLRTPPRQARSQARDQTWPGAPAPDAASTIDRTDSTDTIGLSERTEPWRTDDWRPQHHPQALKPEPAMPTPVERLARASLTVLGAGGGLLFLHVRLLGQSEQGRDGRWALERVEAVDAVTGTTRWTVTTPHGCESAVSPAGRIVALWRRNATPLMIHDATRVFLLDGASGQLLARFRLGADRTEGAEGEEKRLPAAPLEVAPVRTAEEFRGVTDDGVAYLAHERRASQGRELTRALSAASVVDRAARPTAWLAQVPWTGIGMPPTGT